MEASGYTCCYTLLPETQQIGLGLSFILKLHAGDSR